MTSALKVEGSKKYPNLRTNSIQGVRKSTFFAVFKRNWIFCFGRIRIFGHPNCLNIRTNTNILTIFVFDRILIIYPHSSKESTLTSYLDAARGGAASEVDLFKLIVIWSRLKSRLESRPNHNEQEQIYLASFRGQVRGKGTRL